MPPRRTTTSTAGTTDDSSLLAHDMAVLGEIIINLKEAGKWKGPEDSDAIMIPASKRIGTWRALVAMAHIEDGKRIFVRGRGWRTFSWDIV